MPAELGDPRSFKRAMRTIAGEVGKEAIEAAVRDAVTHANRILLESTPPPEASMDEWHVEPIAESVTIDWQPSEPSEGKLAKGTQLVAEWEHEHSDKIEVGVRPHMIEGDPYLAWHDRETGELIVRTKVNHPGIPGVGYIRGGFRRAIREHFG